MLKKLKILEKSLDLEKEKIENEAFEARSKAIVAEYESTTGHLSNGNNWVASKSSSGHLLLAENTLQNERICNHMSHIRLSNVQNETTRFNKHW